MKAFNVRGLITEVAIPPEEQSTIGAANRTRFVLRSDLNDWLVERGEQTKLYYNNIIIKDETVALEFKLTWL